MSEPSSPTQNSADSSQGQSEPVVSQDQQSEASPTPFAQASEASSPFAHMTDSDESVADTGEPITWTALEFIDHEKGITWYLSLAVVALVFAAIVYLVSKDKISVVVILGAALMLAVYSRRKPRQLEYKIDNQGINVGSRHFAYESFKSFSIVPEAGFSSIVFMPMKRFAIPITLYHAPEDGDNILNMLSARLPLENHKPDSIDKLMRKIRF